ncbi:MAG TPA: cupin domain-containing protein [Blastocatellia bacterium]|nr:cupin domain-containing protein [Blastocatellia bacterium]
MSATNPNRSAIAVRSGDGRWQSSSAPGVFLKVLHSNSETGEATYLLKFEAGASFPAHSHPGGEEVFVIEGDLQLGKHELSAGDYLYTPPDGKHAAVSKSGCTVLVRVAKPIEIIE